MLFGGPQATHGRPSLLQPTLEGLEGNESNNIFSLFPLLIPSIVPFCSIK